MLPSVSALPQPAPLPRTRPHTIPNAAPVISARPGRSSARSLPRDSGMRASTSGTASSPIGTLIQKIHCQARPSAIAPPITGPPPTARPVRPCSAPIAEPRRSGGNAAPTSVSASGMTNAAPTPWTARATISAVASGASAQAAEARANSARPAANRRRRPKRSPSADAVISSTAKQRL